MVLNCCQHLYMTIETMFDLFYAGLYIEYMMDGWLVKGAVA